MLPRRVGNYLVAVTLNGEPILGSRFALSVSGDGAHPGSCVAAGSGLRRMVAGELGRFTVQAWDAYGNIVRRRIFEPGGGAGPAARVWGVARALLSSPFPSTFASPNSPPLTPPPPPPRRRRVAGGAEAARLPGASTAGLGHLQRPVWHPPPVADPSPAELGQQSP